jgi:hypothetical protein
MGIAAGTPNGAGAAAPEAGKRCCSRCRGLFPVTDASRHVRPGEWWLCPACHDTLIGPGSRSRRDRVPAEPAAVREPVSDGR